MGRFLSLGMIDSEEVRQKEKERERDGEETRAEVRPMIDEDRPVGPTYRQKKNNKNKTTTIKTVC